MSSSGVASGAITNPLYIPDGTADGFGWLDADNNAEVLSMGYSNSGKVLEPNFDVSIQGHNSVTLYSPNFGNIAVAKDDGGVEIGGAVTLYTGNGAPGGALGNNGDIYLNQVGGADTTVYQKRAGAWVGIV